MHRRELKLSEGEIRRIGGRLRPPSISDGNTNGAALANGKVNRHPDEPCFPVTVLAQAIPASPQSQKSFVRYVVGLLSIQDNPVRQLRDRRVAGLVESGEAICRQGGVWSGGVHHLIQRLGTHIRPTWVAAIERGGADEGRGRERSLGRSVASSSGRSPVGSASSVVPRPERRSSTSMAPNSRSP